MSFWFSHAKVPRCLVVGHENLEGVICEMMHWRRIGGVELVVARYLIRKWIVRCFVSDFFVGFVEIVAGWCGIDVIDLDLGMEVRLSFFNVALAKLKFSLLCFARSLSYPDSGA